MTRKSISKRNKKKTARERISEVIIPGSTGGFYTLIPGVSVIFILLAIYVYAFFAGKEVPEPFVELLWVGVALMGVHNGRAVFNDRANGRVAEAAIEYTESGEEVEVDSGNVSMKVDKKPVTEEEKESVKG